MPGNLGKLPRDSRVIQSAILNECAKLQGVRHGLADHLEDLTLKNMRANPRIAASVNRRPVVHVFLRLAIAAVDRPVIDGHFARGLYHLVVSSRGRTAGTTDPTLDKPA